LPKFVDKICYALNIELKFTGPTATYIKRLRATGNSDAKFEISDEIARKMGCTSRNIEFDSHTDLDKFVRAIERQIPGYFETRSGIEDKILLEAFDRAFWLRYGKTRSKDSAPDECPFHRDEIFEEFTQGSRSALRSKSEPNKRNQQFEL
jgi:hypothetical protein